MNDERPTMGRPTLYTPELADLVLAHIAIEEKSLTKACELAGIAKGTFLGWVIDNHYGLSDRYMRARKIRAYGRLDEIIEIADDAEEDPKRSDIKVKARQWELVRILRNEFGDKLELGGELGLAIKGARERLAGLLGGDDPAPGAESPPPAAAEEQQA